MDLSHRRIIMDRELLLAVKEGNELRFAQLVGLEADERRITVGESCGIANGGSIARYEPNFFQGVTVTGNSLLHLAASSSKFLDMAEKIWRRDASLLMCRNKVLDTPLHCAVRNGDLEMVSRFIGFAREMGEGAVVEVLRAKNRFGETALHDAARHNYKTMATALINADPKVVGMVDDKMVSPLYLATITGSVDVARSIISSLSTREVIARAFVSGPEGQTVLHAAVVQTKELIQELLNWQPLLAKMPDNTGSTPLHYVASFGDAATAQILLNHDYSVAYLHDSHGSFPVHVAASLGHVEILKILLKYCPDSDELVDIQGRNFLHVAAQNEHDNVVQYICLTKGKHKIMKNARDNEGNTPLHVALHVGRGWTLENLLSDEEVLVCISNKKGLNPRDLSEIGLFINAIKPSIQIVDNWVKSSMKLVGARCSAWRQDHFFRDNTIKKDLEKENENLNNAIQNIGFASVLIATVTFTAAFTLPGGYRADDHQKGGTPTLAKKYAFKAFLVADTIAFFGAFYSTLILLVHTSSEPQTKKHFASLALWITIITSRCMVIAFVVAVFVVIVPVSKFLGILALLVALCFLYYEDSPELLYLDLTYRRFRAKQNFKVVLPRSIYNLLVLVEISLPFAAIFLLPLLCQF